MNHVSASILGFLLSLLVVAATAGCSRTKPDAALTRVSAIVSDDPERAVAMLDSIDTGKLTDADRHLHDFLTIKALDKAYVTHESDSLILDVIDYYSSRPKDPIYTESLYYGGRVYTDLGDYPTALRYYHNALDNLDVSTDTTNLSVRLNSQIGMLFETLRLYDKAKSYYEAVLKQKLAEQDSVVIVYTLQRLGGISHECGEQELADSFLTKSLDYAVSLPEYFPAMSKVILAAVKSEKGDLKTALSFIRNTPDRVKPISRNVALAHAADIYLEAGIMDTAYMYAHELVANEDMLNKKTGYRILTSSEFRKFLHPDTLDKYYADYKQVLEDYFNDNRNELTLLQKSKYDYSLHERESIKAREEKERMRWLATGSSFLVVILVLTILLIKYRNKSNLVRLHEALDSLEVLKRQLSLAPNMEAGQATEGPMNGETRNTESALRQRLRQELMDLYEASGHQGISPIILESEVYSEIQRLLKEGKPMKGEIWDELEKVVLSASPNFMDNLELLTQNRITSVDREAALLIKCGFRPTDMTVLLSLSNGGVISRRESLGIKIFDEKESAKVVTGIIRLL